MQRKLHVLPICKVRPEIQWNSVKLHLRVPVEIDKIIDDLVFDIVLDTLVQQGFLDTKTRKDQKMHFIL